MFPRVSIIILNWNGWRDTIECLESLYRITYPNYDVIVVDNGSRDNSVQKIKEYCEGKIKVNSKFFKYEASNKPIYILEYTREQAERGGNFRREKYFFKLPSNRKLRLILNERNYGFAEGNNIGVRYALKALNPDYVLFLNNDTIVDENFLIELVKVAESDKKIGIVGPKVYYYDYRGRTDIISFAGGELDIWRGLAPHIGIKEKDIGQYNKKVFEVKYVEGSCLLIKREVCKKISLKNLSLFDPVYFLYWEDVDVCIRCQLAGYKVVVNPNAKIWHKVSISANKLNIYKLYHFNKNRFIFFKKYFTKNLLTIFIYFVTIEWWIQLIQLLLLLLFKIKIKRKNIK